MSAATETHVDESTILLARALVEAASREGRREAADIEALAARPLPDENRHEVGRGEPLD